jgi:hypothetical protein
MMLFFAYIRQFNDACLFWAGLTSFFEGLMECSRRFTSGGNVLEHVRLSTTFLRLLVPPVCDDESIPL